MTKTKETQSVTNIAVSDEQLGKDYWSGRKKKLKDEYEKTELQSSLSEKLLQTIQHSTDNVKLWTYMNKSECRR